MILLKIILVWIVFILSQVCFSQEEQNVRYGESVSTLFDTKEKTAYFVSELNMNLKPVFSSIQSLQNGVYIEQIGNYNSVKTNLKSDNTAVFISQNGNENEVVFEKQAHSIQARIVQDGQNNSIRDYASYSSYDVNMEFVQRDNNQRIQTYGTNSISKDMKVSQTGTGASVLIINN